MISIDHICLGCRNIYEASHRLREETGLGNYDSGWFPMSGLANRIVPLGGNVYIEIEGVVEAAKVQEGNATAVWFNDVTAKGDVFIGWCARVDSREELEAVAKRLKSNVMEVRGLKIRADGKVLDGVCAPPTIECWKAGVPNFFYFQDMSVHGSLQPLGPSLKPTVTPMGVAWMELGGNEDVMSDWLGVKASSLPLRFNGKAAGLYAVAVKSAAGEIVIRRSPWNSDPG
jgi:glyoxalase-like protein